MLGSHDMSLGVVKRRPCPYVWLGEVFVCRLTLVAGLRTTKRMCHIVRQHRQIATAGTSEHSCQASTQTGETIETRKCFARRRKDANKKLVRKCDERMRTADPYKNQ